MLTVHLSNVKLFAYHGVYPEEALIGNEFLVNLDVVCEESHRQLYDLSTLVNYEVLFEIVRKRMAIPTPLLEEVADSILSKIKHEYPTITSAKISIAKLHPPISKLEGNVGITLEKTYEAGLYP